MKKKAAPPTAQKDPFVVVSFRCPKELLFKIAFAAQQLNVSRMALVTEAVRVFVKEVKKRKGFVIPATTPRKKASH